MWYLGSLGEVEKSLRITGASFARSIDVVSGLQSKEAVKMSLTLTSKPSLVDTCASNHDIVHNRKHNLTANPASLFLLHATVRQDSRFVHFYAPAMSRPC